ncbi:hypothetical protein R3P38DRAFT_3284217 [Favolaschia claudopus]|uniref:F-box domain-containing protein n=1 Tax=Favolaschia claudopus TaxID=2862362 RepID=A0AAW0A5K0_9AGAR
MESPFAHRFGTNYVPTDEEIDQIKLDLLLLSEELARIDERIRELSEQRAKIRAYIEPRKALISHSRRLPMDILEAIFLACLPTSRNAAMSLREAPLLLCRVCSAWRAAALSMPRLWASLHIPVDFIMAKDSRSFAVDQWLNRAAAASMSLSICDTSGGWVWGLPPDSSPASDTLLKSLTRSSASWRNIEFMDMNSGTADALAAIEPLKRLESFKITGDSSHLFQFNLLKGPRLRAVTLLSESDFDLNLAHTLPVAWRQLTHLTIQAARSGDHPLFLRNMILLLEKCPLLVSFHVTLANDESPFEYGSLSILMPFLETFVVPPLYALPHWYLSCITHCVSMPRLRHFHVPIANLDSQSESFALASAGTKLPLVEDLSIYLGSLGPQGLLESLRAYPSLTKLVADAHMWAWASANWDPGSATNSCGTARLIEILTDTLLCPRLQELQVRNSLNLSQSALDAFLLARVELEVPCRLRLFGIAFQSAWDDAQIPSLTPTEIQFYTAQGLHVSIAPTPRAKFEAYTPSPWIGLPGDDNIFHNVQL